MEPVNEDNREVTVKFRMFVALCLPLLALLTPRVSHAYVEWYSIPNPGGAVVVAGPQSNLGPVGGDGTLKFIVARAPAPNWGIAIYDAKSGTLEFDHDLPEAATAIYLSDLDGDSVPEIIVWSGDYVTVFGHQPAITLAVAPSQIGAWGIGSHPNPSASRTSVIFGLEGRGKVQLQVCDLAGRLVRKLVDAPMEAGQHAVDWDGRGDSGVGLPAGTYFYRLSLDDRTIATNKAIRLGN